MARMSARLIKHEAIPNCGSYEVRYSDGRPSRYFYWDDLPGRRPDSNTLTGEQTLEKAKAVARAMRDKSREARNQRRLDASTRASGQSPRRKPEGWRP
jgi:hypothetical protein